MPGLSKYVDDLCDSVDAAVFTGDSLYNQKAINDFKAYLSRWTREVARLETSLASNSDEVQFPRAVSVSTAQAPSCVPAQKVTHEPNEALHKTVKMLAVAEVKRITGETHCTVYTDKRKSTRPCNIAGRQIKFLGLYNSNVLNAINKAIKDYGCQVELVGNQGKHYVMPYTKIVRM